MSTPKRGLGRGLDALLGEAPSAQPSGLETLREIPVARITPNPFQPRKSFDREALDELKNSIATYGVLVPIIVREREYGFELVAGERRWRACAELRRPTITAIVRSADDRDSLEVAMIENLQREDLNPLEEAAGFAHLMEEYGFTQEEVARRVGKSRPAVANTLRLLALPDPIKTMLVEGQLSAGHARALLTAPEQMRLALAERAIKMNLSVRALERLAEGTGEHRRRATIPHPLSADERDFETRLRERFGTHVALVRQGRGGRIELRFASEDELLRLGDSLLGED